MIKYWGTMLTISLFIACSTSKNITYEVGDVLQLLQPELFDDTTEGIETAELNILKSEKKTTNWSLEEYSNYLSITSNHPGSQIFIKLLEPNFLFAHTINGQNLSSKTYQIKGDQLLDSDILPKIEVTNFFEDPSFLNESDKNHLVYVYFDEGSGNIKAGINTWMDPVFEENEPDFDITLIWLKGKFEIKKEKI